MRLIVLVFLMVFSTALFAEDTAQCCFPENVRIISGLKYGVINVPGRNDFQTLLWDTDIRWSTFQIGKKEGYLQLQTPFYAYYINIPSAPVYTLDSRLRIELGPPKFRWFGVLNLDVGYMYQNRDWCAGEMDKPTHSFLVGGLLQFPIIGLKNGVVHTRFGKTIIGDDYTRFSCGARWFIANHVGIHIHADNFYRDKNNKLYRYSGIFAGVLIKS